MHLTSKKWLVASLTLSLSILPAHALPPDSTRTGGRPPHPATQFILPAVLLATGAAGINSSHCPDSPDRIIDRNLEHWRSGSSFHPDDYIQYLPLAATFGLSLAGVPAKHGYPSRIALTATSYLIMAATVNGLKAFIDVRRPDGRGQNSFPSGHTATAFAGAELVRQEFKDASPWYGATAYGVAALTGFLRLYNQRHWLSDVLAGAGIGILSTRIACLLLPWEQKLLFPRQEKEAPSCLLLPYYDPGAHGAGLTAGIAF